MGTFQEWVAWVRLPGRKQWVAMERFVLREDAEYWLGIFCMSDDGYLRPMVSGVAMPAGQKPIPGPGKK